MAPTPQKVRVPSLECDQCRFNNPDGTVFCFGCGRELGAGAVRRLVTVRRPRQNVTRLNASDLVHLRTRVPTDNLFVRRVMARTRERPRDASRRVRSDTESAAPAS